MVSTWRWRRRQPANLWLYVGFSLVFHGAAILALQWADPPLEMPKAEEPPPIEIVDAPKVQIDETPPPDTPNRAARNTVAQGTVQPDAPQNLETTQRATTSAATQPAPPAAEPSPQEPEPAPSPVAQAEPQPEPVPSPVAQPSPEPVPSPVAQPEPKPEPSPRPVARAIPPRPLLPLPPKPAQIPVPQTEASPSPAPQVAPPTQPVARPQPAPTISRPNPQPAPPKVAAAPPQPKGNAALLGGTLSKDARQAPLDQQANTTRNAPGPTQLAARQEVDLGPYLSNLRRRVQERWNPNTPDQRRQAVIGFTISRSGQISNMRVLQTSGNAQTDAETINAIQRAAPFGTLPEQFPHNQLEIEFTFNIYVNNSSVIQTPRSWYGF